MQRNDEFTIRALRGEYSAVVENLCREYAALSRDRAKEDTLEQYIAKHLADAVKSAKTGFWEADQARRMSETAKLFTPETCTPLLKKRYPTGFARLDLALGGGLTEGVLYLGAIASLGKSTFVLQMADHMAAQGIPVVYVSMEMGGDYLTAKLVSMHTFLGSYKTGMSELRPAIFC